MHTCYHLQVNGVAERINRVLKDSLAILVGQHPKDWDRMLPYVHLGLNMSTHTHIHVYVCVCSHISSLGN